LKDKELEMGRYFESIDRFAVSLAQGEIRFRCLDESFHTYEFVLKKFAGKGSLPQITKHLGEIS